jgi:replicative DNA helicase
MEDIVLEGLIPLNLNDREEVWQTKANILSCMAKRLVFHDESNKLIYNVIVSYFKSTQNFLDANMFTSVLQDNQVDPELLAKASIKFNLLLNEKGNTAARVPFSQDAFKFNLNRLARATNKAEFSDTLVEALNMLSQKDDLEGNQTSLDKAKELIIPKLFDSAMIAEDVPHGDVTNEREEILTEYEEAKANQGVVNGILTGYSKIDAAIDAIQPGQLIVLAGASGEGKSWMAANIAVNVAMGQKKNVVIITAETLRQQYRRRLYVCHSNNPKFGYPIEFEKAKNGSFTEEEEEQFRMVVKDFTSGEYGKIEVSQISNGTTISDITVYLEKINLSMPIDLVILDYLTLFRPSRRSGNQNQREDAVALFKEAKNLAITFNNGQGIPVLTLHQISNQARDIVKFEPGKYFTLSSLADSSEAGKSADVAMALLRTEEMQEAHELGFGILKSRDSYAPDRLFKLFENFQTAYVGDLEE